MCGPATSTSRMSPILVRATAGPAASPAARTACEAPQQPPGTHPRSLKHRPEGASRTVPIPPQFACLLRWHMRAFGYAEDGRLFRGGRGGPLSESLYGRIWHQARTAAIPGLAGTWPVRRPRDLRHAALSLWLASGAPPADVAARAGHSVHVLLTTYAHGIPGCDQIASQHIDRALRSSRWPPAGPQEPARTPGIASSCVLATAGPSGTQLDQCAGYCPTLEIRSTRPPLTRAGCWRRLWV